MFPRACARFKVKYLFLGLVFVIILDFFGVFTHMFELDYHRHFRYPLDGDVLRYAHQVRFNMEREREPINIYNYTYLKDAHTKCEEDGAPVTPKLVFIVKSAMDNFDRRNAIRKSWGYERRFSDVIIRTIFMLGVSDNRELQKHIDIEHEQYHDIVQANFIDSYYNNTIKTMMGLQWAVRYCPRSRYFMFVDDDYYISTKNVLRFIKNPTKYPEYLEEADETLRKLARRLNQSDLRNATANEELIKEANKVLSQGLHAVEHKKHFHNLEEFVVKGPVAYEREHKRHGRQLLDQELSPEAKLYAGFVFTTAPQRHRSSRWYVSLAEYPYHLWPSYVTAGAYLLSREALNEMYYTSMFTKHFRFDDVYLGIVALKAQIKPFHCVEFYFHKAVYTGPHSYRYVVASHGYDNPAELTKVWTQTRAAGYA